MTEPMEPDGGPPAESPDEPPLRLRSRFAAIVFLVGALITAGAVAAILLDDDDPEATLAPTSTSTGPSTSLTTTTTVVGVTVPGPDSPTTAPPTTAETTTATTAPAPDPTTTAPPPSPACGNGAVHAAPIPTRADDDGRYPTRGEVVSEFDRPIEINRFTIRVTFDDGTSQDVELHTTGVVVPPGERRLVSGPTIDPDGDPIRWETIRFVYQPEGRPDCAVST